MTWINGTHGLIGAINLREEQVRQDMTAQHGKRRHHVRHESEAALALGSEAACFVAAKSLALRAEEMRRRHSGLALTGRGHGPTRSKGGRLQPDYVHVGPPSEPLASKTVRASRARLKLDVVTSPPRHRLDMPHLPSGVRSLRVTFTNNALDTWSMRWVEPINTPDSATAPCETANNLPIRSEKGPSLIKSQDNTHDNSDAAVTAYIEAESHKVEVMFQRAHARLKSNASAAHFALSAARTQRTKSV